MLHDEPLVRFDNAERNLLSVSPGVNAKTYHDAFLNMPIPKPVAEAAYIQAGRILRRADGKDEEYLVAIDARTGALVVDNLGRMGYAGSTTFTVQEKNVLQTHAYGVITVHNHPHNRMPSYRDVMTASKNRMVMGSIVLGHDGSVLYVSARTESVADELERLYNQLKDDLGDRAEIRALDEMIERAGKVGLIWLNLR